MSLLPPPVMRPGKRKQTDLDPIIEYPIAETDGPNLFDTRRSYDYLFPQSTLQRKRMKRKQLEDISERDFARLSLAEPANSGLLTVDTNSALAPPPLTPPLQQGTQHLELSKTPELRRNHSLVSSCSSSPGIEYTAIPGGENDYATYVSQSPSAVVPGTPAFRLAVTPGAAPHTASAAAQSSPGGLTLPSGRHAPTGNLSSSPAQLLPHTLRPPLNSPTLPLNISTPAPPHTPLTITVTDMDKSQSPESPPQEQEDVTMSTSYDLDPNRIYISSLEEELKEDEPPLKINRFVLDRPTALAQHVPESSLVLYKPVVPVSAQLTDDFAAFQREAQRQEGAYVAGDDAADSLAESMDVDP